MKNLILSIMLVSSVGCFLNIESYAAETDNMKSSKDDGKRILENLKKCRDNYLEQIDDLLEENDNSKQLLLTFLILTHSSQDSYKGSWASDYNPDVEDESILCVLCDRCLSDLEEKEEWFELFESVQGDLGCLLKLVLFIADHESVLDIQLKDVLDWVKKTKKENIEKWGNVLSVVSVLTKIERIVETLIENKLVK